MKKNVLSKFILFLMMFVLCVSVKTNTKAAENNNFNVCGSETALQVSVNCKESDEITFKCESCPAFNYKYTGYSGITIGTWSQISKNYDVTFGATGEY